MLEQIDPRRALLIISCSAAKVRGGQRALPGPREEWPETLRKARVQVLAGADLDVSGDLPASRRYDGGFYRSARPALAEAAAAGRVVIISGGYGVARAQEPIGWYDKVLRLADWPRGLLESALIEQARRQMLTALAQFAVLRHPEVAERLLDSAERLARGTDPVAGSPDALLGLATASASIGDFEVARELTAAIRQGRSHDKASPRSPSKQPEGVCSIQPRM